MFSDSGFMYLNGTYTGFQGPGASGTGATSFSNNGLIAGSYQDSAYHLHGFVLKDGEFTTIDFPLATETEVFAIEDSGRLAGQYIGPSCPLVSQDCGFIATPR
jgi:uncharacterized membrane protein